VGFCSIDGWKYGSFLLANEAAALAGTMLLFAWLVARHPMKQKHYTASQVVIGLSVFMCCAFFQKVSRCFSSYLMIEAQSDRVVEHPGQVLAVGILATVLSFLPLALVAYSEQGENEDSDVMRLLLGFFVVLFIGFSRLVFTSAEAIGGYTEWKYGSFLAANEIVAMVGYGLVLIWITAYGFSELPDERQETECLQANE
jgi:hypothetical protein